MTLDAEVRDALRIAASTLRGLIADGRRAGIPPPFAGTERLRRWRGDELLWSKWMAEVQRWRASKKETAGSESGGEPSPESPAVESAPTAKRPAHSKPKSSEKERTAATGQKALKLAIDRALTTSPPHTSSTAAAASRPGR